MDNYPITSELINDVEVVGKPVQMIKGDGTFCESKVEKFVESATNLALAESHAIISIIGPQSSGKSYLLNLLFGCEFEVMNAERGRQQTTQGIWLARSAKPCALIMDVEGADGTKRGEDNVLFERQSALFALTVSDVMMVNMWLHDIGRQQGGGLPLLKTVFQERVKLARGRTKVMVVIRAYDKETPFETLEKDVRTKLEGLWVSVHDRHDGTVVQFKDYIEVIVVALPDKVLKREFNEEVRKLIERFAKKNIVGLRQDKNATLGFSLSAKNIWEAIKQNKQLDLPSNKLAVSTYVCEKVAEKCLATVVRDEDFNRLNDAASSDEFIVKLEALLKNCVTRYNNDTAMSDETQRDAKRDALKEKFLQSAEPSAKKLLQKIRGEIFSENKDKVTALLNTADDSAREALASTIVEDVLVLFIRLCGGLISKYKLLCLENRDMLRTQLKFLADATILQIKEKQRQEREDEAARRYQENQRQQRENEAAWRYQENQRQQRENEAAWRYQENQRQQREDEAARRYQENQRQAARRRNARMIGLQLGTAIARLMFLGDPTGFFGF